MNAGALREALEGSAGPAIVCAQAGNVNTGASDPFTPIAEACEAVGAWLHVDGAFGLWAAASPPFEHQVAGIERADSWATDAHKWLNVPYDCGVVFCRHPEAHGDAMAVAASYLQRADGRSPSDWVPESSRRARDSRSGRRYGPSVATGSWSWSTAVATTRVPSRPSSVRGRVEILNDVVLNQVLVRFHDDDEATREVSAVFRPTAPAGSADRRQGRAAMRISVSSFRTQRETSSDPRQPS
jgi:glutamate/tyrosine decarboxylase-like PLP-dependent enzyme